MAFKETRTRKGLVSNTLRQLVLAPLLLLLYFLNLVRFSAILRMVLLRRRGGGFQFSFEEDRSPKKHFDVCSLNELRAFIRYIAHHTDTQIPRDKKIMASLPVSLSANSHLTFRKTMKFVSFPLAAKIFLDPLL